MFVKVHTSAPSLLYFIQEAGSIAMVNKPKYLTGDSQGITEFVDRFNVG